MNINGISELIANFSLEQFFRGDFSVIAPLLYLAISIAIYAIIIWHFYRYIARRDCFKMSSSNHPRLVSFLKYFFIFPFVAFLFFIGFSLMLLFLTKNYDIYQVLTTSFAIIFAIRMTAYYSEDLSKDLAKMLPFALLGVFLVDPSYFNFETIKARVFSLPEFFTLVLQYLFFIILIEWILRLLRRIKLFLFKNRCTPLTETET